MHTGIPWYTSVKYSPSAPWQNAHCDRILWQDVEYKRNKGNKRNSSYPEECMRECDLFLKYKSSNIPSTVYVCRQTLPSAVLTQIELECTCNVPKVYVQYKLNVDFIRLVLTILNGFCVGVLNKETKKERKKTLGEI